MIKILMIFFLLLLFPLLFDFHVLLMDTCSRSMAFRAETDSAVSFIIPTYVLVSFYNIIYIDGMLSTRLYRHKIDFIHLSRQSRHRCLKRTLYISAKWAFP